MHGKINILLATYNGEKYISEQIESLLASFKLIQNYDCKIILSDDGSSDNTLEIVSQYISKNSCINIINTDRKGGPNKNFEYLLKHADNDADYVFFCDQDDVWFPEKISIFIDTFKSIETPSLPILMHSDLIVTDNTLVPLENSLFSSQRLHENPTLMNLIVQNSVTGCACAINQPLLNVLKKCEFDYSIMHDWYIAIIATLCGRIVFIPKPTLFYRQHDKNVLGAKKIGVWDLCVNYRTTLRKLKNSAYSIENTRKQCCSILSEDVITISPYEKKLLRKYIDSFGGTIRERITLFKMGFRKYSYIRNICFFFIYVFFIKNKTK